jgi:hypothetical protein
VLDALGVSVSLGSAVGSGTFVSDRFADAPFYASTLGVQPSLQLGEHLALTLDLSGTFEWTRWVTPCRDAWGPRTAGAPRRDCSDTDEANARRWDLGDIGLSLAHARLAAPAGIALSASVGVGFPASRASRATGLVASLGAGVGASRALGPVTLSVDAGVRKFAVGAEANVLDAADVEDARIPVTRCASFRRTDCVLLSGFVASWMATGGLSARVELPADLSAGLALGYAYSRSFGTGRDARSSPRVDADGRPVVDGVNEADTTSGSLDVTWAPREDLGLSLGLSSLQPARTADGKRLRFPLWDLVSPANNFSALFLEVRYTR